MTDEEIEEGDRRILRSDVPPLRSDVAYVLDRASQDAALQVRRLNEMGSLGVLEVRAKHARLVSERASVEFELASLVNSNPWLAGSPPVPRWSFRSYALGALAALLVLVVIYAAATRPTLSRGAAQNAALETKEPAPIEQGRVEP